VSVPPEVAAFYASFLEESRLTVGPARLEFERTKDLLARLLPPPPAKIVDVGGAGGAYSLWLAAQGYDVDLVDASRRLVDVARAQSARAEKPIASLHVADARSLPQSDASAAAVLVMGPLYHLQDAADRARALAETFRVLAPGGVAVVAAISRYASTLDGMARKLSLDPRFVAIRDRDLADGAHSNTTDNPDYFTTAYLHRPEDLRRELTEAGLEDVAVFGIEGPGWILPDFGARWGDPALRKDLLDVARALEDQPSIVGISAHLLGTGRKP
jgi:ubiquinone/menaquinone biosynthesis C-methylase UbiE